GGPAGGPGGGAPGGGGGRGGGTTAPVAVQGAVNRNMPSSPIMPISNPISPIANPRAPVVPYGGAPGLGVPNGGRPVAAQGVVNRIDRRRDFPVVVVGGPY